jgi:hypothetical protein
MTETKPTMREEFLEEFCGLYIDGCSSDISNYFLNEGSICPKDIYDWIEKKIEEERKKAKIEVLEELGNNIYLLDFDDVYVGEKVESYIEEEINKLK